ncbi:hypothetical protein ACS0TY_019525 [Phlomoides rotata]
MFYASEMFCTPLLGMAMALGASGRASEAIETYQRVIKIFESVVFFPWEKHGRVGIAMRSLAQVKKK